MSRYKQLGEIMTARLSNLEPRFLRQGIRCGGEPEDIVQSACLRALRQIQKQDDISSHRTPEINTVIGWLAECPSVTSEQARAAIEQISMRCLRHEIIDRFRASQRQPRLTSIEIQEIDESKYEDFELERVEIRELVVRVMKLATSEEAKVLQLILGGQTHRQIAIAIGRNAGTVSKRLHELRGRLVAN